VCKVGNIERKRVQYVQSFLKPDILNLRETVSVCLNVYYKVKTYKLYMIKWSFNRVADNDGCHSLTDLIWILSYNHPNEEV